MHRTTTRAVAALAVAVALGATACSKSNDNGGGGGSFNGAGLTGAGSTFAAPIYQLWAHNFQSVESATAVNYQAIGSGGGIDAFTKQTVDFGATDVPLQTDEISALGGKPYVEFPSCLGAVVLAYNLPSVTTPLQLDGQTIANIFLGTITKWNDPAIAATNSGVKLPATSIQVAHRADESGTTAVWTAWLSLQSKEWSTKVGSGKAVQWPVGVGGNGNDGVAGAISQTEGSVGYLSYDFAVTAKLGIASIKAPDGSFVAPSIDSISKAGGGLAFPINPDTNILDSKTTGAYPVASTTYVLIDTNQTDKNKAQALVDFWTWALTTGQSQTNSINYAPLPRDFATSALAELKKVTVNGQAITASSAVSG